MSGQAWGAASAVNQTKQPLLHNESTRQHTHTPRRITLRLFNNTRHTFYTSYLTPQTSIPHTPNSIMTQHSENASQQQPTTQRVGDQPRQQQPRDVPPHMAGVGRTANLLITRQNFSFTPGEEPIDLTSGPLWVSADFFKVLSHGGSNEGVANRVIGNFLTVLFNLGIKLDCKVRLASSRSEMSTQWLILRSLLSGFPFPRQQRWGGRSTLHRPRRIVGKQESSPCAAIAAVPVSPSEAPRCTGDWLGGTSN